MRLLLGIRIARFVFLLLVFWLSANTKATAQNFWQQTNGPYGGEIRALTINSRGDIFAGTFAGGVFRSNDNGGSWTAVNFGLTSRFVYALAINPSGHIFAGTDDGVFRSTDTGDSWVAVKTGLTNATVSALAINANGHVFAGTRGGGVFRSTDSGGIWIRVNTGLANTDVLSLAINSSGHIFTGTYAGGVFRSTDNGDSWMAVNTGLTSAEVLSLAINANGHIFAGTGIDGVFRSTDSGGSWTPVNTGLTNPNVSTSVSALAINSSGHIFAASGGIFRSTDNGGSWTPVNTGLTNVIIYSVAINSNGHIFVGTDGGGVFRSTDNGGSWTEVNTGLTNTGVSALAINSNGDIFSGTGRDGVFRSIDNGGSWTEVNTGLMRSPFGFIYVSALAINSSGHIFAGTGDGVFRSTDNGESWVDTGLTLFNGIVLAINSSGHIFAGNNGDGVSRSMDNGVNWTAVNNGLTNTDITVLAINLNGHIFAGTREGVFRSTDNGGSWTNLNFPDSFVLSFAANASGHIFAGTWNRGVFRSNDNGNSWTAVNNGLLDINIPALTINSSGHILAGTFNRGVFLSTDNGDSWTQINTGLANTSTFTFVSVNALAINTSGFIFAGTGGTGVFRSVKSTLLPIATTSIATNVLLTSATLNGTVNPNGLNTTIQFEYGTTTSYGNMVTATPSPITGTSPVSVSANTMGLSPNTTYHYRVVATNSEGTSNGANQTFRTTTSVDSESPTISNVGANSIVDFSMPIAVSANVTDNVGVQKVKLFYREGGKATFDSTDMSLSQGLYRAMIPGSFAGTRGVEFKIQAADSANNLGATAWRPVQVRLPDKHLSKAQIGGSAENAYRLVSFPLASDDPDIASNLLDDLGTGTTLDTTQWRVWDIDPQKADTDFPYREYPAVGPLLPGKSIFFITKENKTLTSGAGVTVTTTEPFNIDLKPGWNMIASPFNFDIPIQNVKPDSLRDDLYAYNGAFASFPSSLKPWEGYMIKVKAPVTLTIQPSEIPQAGSSTITKLVVIGAKPTASIPDWFIRVQATCERASDVDNLVGVVQDAAIEWDRYERFEPPPIGKFVMVSFPHREWQRYPDVYTTDFRPPSSDGHAWDFTVSSNISGKPVTLRFDNLASLPPEYEIKLVDLSLKLAQDLRREAQYVFRSNSSEGKKTFRLLIGKAAFIAERNASVAAAPVTYELAQNFPNPFNPSTSIKFGLPQKSRVSLRIYNLVGKEVAVLFDGAEKEAGYHAAIWEGKDQRGNAMPSGIYIFRLIVGDVVLTKKMTLLK
jgi:ligand-binding sensor domain-containing protein